MIGLDELNKAATDYQYLINAVNIGWVMGCAIVALLVWFHKKIIYLISSYFRKRQVDATLCDEVRQKLDVAIVSFIENTDDDDQMKKAMNDVAFLLREAKTKLSKEIAGYLDKILQDMSLYRNRNLISNQLGTKEGDEAAYRCVDAYTRTVSLQTAEFFRPYIVGNKK